MEETIEYNGQTYKPKGSSEVTKRLFFNKLVEGLRGLESVQIEEDEIDKPRWGPPHKLTFCYSKSPDGTDKFSLLETIYFRDKIPFLEGRRYDVSLEGNVNGEPLFDVGRDIGRKEIRFYDPKLLEPTIDQIIKTFVGE